MTEHQPTAEEQDYARKQKASIRETRRALIATQALGALLMHAGANASDHQIKACTGLAVRAADLLLAELEKEKRP